MKYKVVFNNVKKHIRTLLKPTKGSNWFEGKREVRLTANGFFGSFTKIF